METNGTLVPPPGIDWLCVSPKADAPLAVQSGQELKLVFPQVGVDPERFAAMAFDKYYLSPMDGPNRRANTEKAIDYCQRHPQWNLSVQTHKMIGIR
jgi:7-carboxy-7-deazaguanine synthase